MEPMKTNEMVLSSIRAFMKSRILLTGVELDLFTQIDRGINSADALAEKNHLDLRALARLLDAIVVTGMLKKTNSRYSLTPEGACLSSDYPETPIAMVHHVNELWDSWSHLTQAVRSGKNPEHTPVAKKDNHSLAAFIGAMHVVGKGLSREIAADLDLSAYHRLLDIGGASGTYTIAFLERNPRMTSVIFDLKKVIPLAEKRLADMEIRNRVTLIGGDFYTGPLPTGCDLALLSAIIHQNGREQNVALYKKINKSLEPGGTLMIRDHIMNEDRTSPPAGAFFAINMLSVTQHGDTYTFKEVRQDMETAGFTDIRQIRSGEKMDCIITGRKTKAK